MRPLKVLIATGGTGGHLFPSRQLAELLKGAEVAFAGHGLESSPFFDRKIPYHEVASVSSLKKWPALIKGVWQGVKLLLRLKPDVVVGFGSYHSFPVLMAALLLRKKIILFEANCTLGKVNRFFAPFAKKIALQFPIPHKKGAYVPLLPWVAKPKGKSSYQKDPNRMTILVFGGSQGAAFINKTFCEAAKRLSFPFQVIHLTGKEDREIQYEVPSIVKPFEEDMASAYEVADLVVCRCGAGTVAELIQHQLPAILIPYPFAHDHQRKNGEYLKNGARMLLQKEATPERLAKEIEELMMRRDEYKKALSEISFPNTIDFAHLVRTVGEEK